jgi:hypothetical protein
MKRKLKKIASLFLLLVFLFPTVVIIEHHHEQNICQAKNEKHYHVFHEKCNICSFEFSVFSSTDKNIEQRKEIASDHYFNHYQSQFYFNQSAFSFLLRAPPVYTT